MGNLQVHKLHLEPFDLKGSFSGYIDTLCKTSVHATRTTFRRYLDNL